ncbi:MAG: ABC1 kinase family protein [Silvanigrellaceae bacterium]
MIKDSDSRKRALSLLRTLGSTAVRAGGEKLKRSLSGTPAEGILESAAALRLAQGLDELKGAAMKMGQMLSLADDTVLPKPWREALSRLQSHASPRPWPEIRPVIEGALLGEWPFARIEEEAVHAASIGQVHKAWLKNGLQVAVKVRYPGLEYSVHSDLENIRRVLSLANILPAKANYDDIFARVESLFLQELNFLEEKKFYKLYRDCFANSSEILIPAIVEEHSNENILISEWIEGINLKDWIANNGAPDVANDHVAARDKIGRILLDLLFFEIFDNGFIQSDPNPANFLVTPDGRLCLLDFGATEELGPVLRENYRQLSKACLFGTRNDIIRMGEKMNLILDSDNDKARDSFVQMMAITCEPFVHNIFSWKNCQLTQRLKDKILAFATSTRLRPPPAELMFLNRRILGTQMLLEQLGPTIHARSIILERIGK